MRDFGQFSGENGVLVMPPTLGVSIPSRTTTPGWASWWFSFFVGAAGMALIVGLAALNWLLVLWLLGVFRPETTSPLA